MEEEGKRSGSNEGTAEVSERKIPNLLRRGKIEAWVIREASKPLIERRRLRIEKGMLVDKWNSKKYAVTSEPILVFDRNKVKEVYLCDEKTAATMNVEIDRKENPHWKLTPSLLYSVIDSRLLQYAFAIRPERKTVVAALVLGAFLGFLIGVMFG